MAAIPMLSVRPSLGTTLVCAAVCLGAAALAAQQVFRGRVVEGSGGRQVRVTVTIDGSGLTFEKQGDRWVGEIDVVVLCGTRNQKVTGTLTQRMTLGMDDARYNVATTTGIPYTVTVPVSERSANVKVLVYEFASDKMGTVVASIKQRR